MAVHYWAAKNKCTGVQTGHDSRAHAGKRPQGHRPPLHGRHGRQRSLALRDRRRETFVGANRTSTRARSFWKFFSKFVKETGRQPAGVRGLRNTSQKEMVYICIQSRENSLEEHTYDDGTRVACTPGSGNPLKKHPALRPCVKPGAYLSPPRHGAGSLQISSRRSAPSSSASMTDRLLAVDLARQDAASTGRSPRSAGSPASRDARRTAGRTPGRPATPCACRLAVFERGCRSLASIRPHDAELDVLRCGSTSFRVSGVEHHDLVDPVQELRLEAAASAGRSPAPAGLLDHLGGEYLALVERRSGEVLHG